MSPDQISSLIDQKLANYSNKSQFGVSAVQRHTHNGSDSPKVTYKSLSNTPTIPVVYGGSIASSGSPIFLPPGWSSSRTTTGTYQIIHNLGTVNYAAVFTPGVFTPAGNDDTLAVVTSVASASFTVTWIVAGSGGTVNTPFFFILCVQ